MKILIKPAMIQKKVFVLKSSDQIEAEIGKVENKQISIQKQRNIFPNVTFQKSEMKG